MPALTAEVPRQYHTGPILPPHTRYFNLVHEEQKVPRPYTRSEQMAEQITRTWRSNTTPASSTPQNICVPPSSTVYHVREHAAGPQYKYWPQEISGKEAEGLRLHDQGNVQVLGDHVDAERERCNSTEESVRERVG